MPNYVEPRVNLVYSKNNLSHIERCGRICYKSEDKITDNSAPKFYAMIKYKTHLSVFEHAGVYLKTKWYQFFNPSVLKLYGKMIFNPYATVRGRRIYTNQRVVEESILKGKEWKDSVLRYMYQFAPKLRDMHRIHTALFICDRGVSHELVRHRKASFSQESTRYCNYINSLISFVMPEYINRAALEDYHVDKRFKKTWTDREKADVKNFVESCISSEKFYMEAIAAGQTPQQARGRLTNDLKTEVMMSMSLKWWKHFMILRTSKAAHPEMRKLALQLRTALTTTTGVELPNMSN